MPSDNPLTGTALQSPNGDHWIVDSDDGHTLSLRVPGLRQSTLTITHYELETTAGWSEVAA